MNVNDLFRQIIKEVRAGYLPEWQETKSDEECLGVALAQFFDWDSRFIEATIFAAEEANFHTFGRLCEEYLDRRGSI